MSRGRRNESHGDSRSTVWVAGLVGVIVGAVVWQTMLWLVGERSDVPIVAVSGDSHEPPAEDALQRSTGAASEAESLVSTGFDQRVSANDNDWVEVERELRSPEYRGLIERRLGRELAEDVEFDLDEIGEQWGHFGTFRGLTSSGNAAVQEEIVRYAELRWEGHSRAYAFLVLGEAAESEIDREDIAAITDRHGPVYEPWLVADGTHETGDTEYRYFHLVDGDLAWTFEILSEEDRGERHVFLQRADALDYDPAFEEVFAAAREEANRRLEEAGIKGQMGSVHSYWDYKKQYLRERGIEWRSPSELNPNTIYD